MMIRIIILLNRYGEIQTNFGSINYRRPFANVKGWIQIQKSTFLFLKVYLQIFQNKYRFFKMHTNKAVKQNMQTATNFTHTNHT